MERTALERRERRASNREKGLAAELRWVHDQLFTIIREQQSEIDALKQALADQQWWRAIDKDSSDAEHCLSKGAPHAPGG